MYEIIVDGEIEYSLSKALKVRAWAKIMSLGINSLLDRE